MAKPKLFKESKMDFKNVDQHCFSEKFTSLRIGEPKESIDLKEQCDFLGSDYAMFEDDSTRAELNWKVFTDSTKSTPKEYMAIYFHDVQSYALKKAKEAPEIEDKELDFVTFEKEWDEVEFHFKKGRVIKVSAMEIEVVTYPLSEGPQETPTP